MTHIKVTKGLDIPIKGKPEGSIKPLLSTELKEIALDLAPFDDVKFRLLVQPGDPVKLGQPLAEDKDSPGKMFVSPAGGTVREIRRGLKRRLLDIVIEVAKQEEIQTPTSTNDLIEKLKTGGLFPHIRQRPFNVLANPNKTPRSIFVKAVESAPFVPPAELQVIGHEKEFQAGLEALSKLTQIHLVYHKNCSFKPFIEAKNVQKHTVEGPHPAANYSLHIHHIDPIRSAEDIIWTLDAHAVVAIGYYLLHGRYFVDRIISIAGPGIIEGKSGFFSVREGYPIELILSGRIQNGPVRYVSGDILTGKSVQVEDFLGFYDYSFCAIPENSKREFLSFLRLGGDKYTFSRTYLSNKNREYDFTTNQHGEHRPFIDPTLYDEVMPLPISTMHLVKAVLAEDYDSAAELGLMEVDSEDFALPTFVCPSKIEMDAIIKKGLRRYATDVSK